MKYLILKKIKTFLVINFRNFPLDIYCELRRQIYSQEQLSRWIWSTLITKKSETKFSGYLHAQKGFVSKKAKTFEVFRTLAT